jgi:hypothetical protein
MRGTGRWIVKPKQQIGLILPTLCVGLVAAGLGGAFFLAARYSAFLALQVAQADDRIVAQFLQETRLILWIFAGAVLLLLVLGLLWSWWISFRVFGPIGRLEKTFAAGLNGEPVSLDLQSRNGDLLQPFLDLLQRYLKRTKT